MIENTSLYPTAETMKLLVVIMFQNKPYILFVSEYLDKLLASSFRRV